MVKTKELKKFILSAISEHQANSEMKIHKE